MDVSAKDIERRPLSTIWRLAWPQTLMMVFHFLIGFIDVFVAGRISSNVQASMGMISQLLFFFLVLAMAVANGSVAAISQSLGAGLHRRILRFIGLSLQLGLAGSAIILMAGWLAKDAVLSLLQVPAEISGIMSYFYDVFLLILPVYYLFIITNAVFRARQQVFQPLYAMILVTTVNTLGDFGLGLGWFGLPELGYKGLAWATFASIACGTVFNVFQLLRFDLLRARSFPPLRWIRPAVGYIFKVAWPGGLMMVVWHSAYMVLYALVASLPEGSVTALAGMSAGLRVESFLFLPGFAFNMTASILVGEYLGKGDPGEAKRMGYRIWLLALGCIGLLTLGLWLVIEPVAAFIAPDPTVAAETVNYLTYNMAAIPFVLTVMTLAGAMNGAGATLYNLLSFSIGSWVIRLPLAWWLGHHALAESTGIWMAMLTSQVLQACMVLYIYTYWPWQRFALVKRRKGQPNGFRTS
ncbi:MATE family efflux transporter [Desulfohalovibrio reitneri]|uniref:MATE family efflux transporter n=1 Tax=Desulfohalovibrio reitneri TaxID=1307759 RepID=UPI0004A7376E|nr:MATE family efflux transporter [Desulfohalovibrio reitneri]